MSLNYGNDVRLNNVVRVSDRMMTPYLFVYGELATDLTVVPKTIPGYPDEFIGEKLDADSYLLIRTLLTDDEVFDTSGVVLEIRLLVNRLGADGIGSSIFVATIRLDDLYQRTDSSGFYGKAWKIGRRFNIKEVLDNYEFRDISLDSVSHMYVTLMLREKSLSTTIGNEWALSVLLNSPAPDN